MFILNKFINDCIFRSQICVWTVSGRARIPGSWTGKCGRSGKILGANGSRLNKLLRRLHERGRHFDRHHRGGWLSSESTTHERARNVRPATDFECGHQFSESFYAISSNVARSGFATSGAYLSAETPLNRLFSVLRVLLMAANKWQL